MHTPNSRSPRPLGIALFCLLCLLSQPTAAEEDGPACIGVANLTHERIEMASKTGSLLRGGIAPRSLDSVCCPAASSLCFDLTGGVAKVKFTRPDPNGLDEFSGTGCRKPRIKPGETIEVDYARDGRHIVCRSVDPAKHAPELAELDTDGDGSVTHEEAAKRRISLQELQLLDDNANGRLDPWEYERDRPNLFKGYSF